MVYSKDLVPKNPILRYMMPMMEKQYFSFWWKWRRTTYFVRGSQSPSLSKAAIPSPNIPLFKTFVSPALFSIAPPFKTFYAVSLIPPPEGQSIIIIQHINLPYTITLKILIYSNQPKPFKFWWNKPNKYCRNIRYIKIKQILTRSQWQRKCLYAETPPWTQHHAKFNGCKSHDSEDIDFSNLWMESPHNKPLPCHVRWMLI